MISIIIPTFNRSGQLAKTLEGLLLVNTDSNLFEVIVIDNGSTDNTKNIIESYQHNSKHIQIHYFFDNVPGLLTGRHRGAQEAKGDILTFIDDDVIVSPEWLNAIIDTMTSKPEITFLTGPNLPQYETPPPEWIDYFWSETPYGGKMCGWLSLLDLGNKTIEIDPNYVWGLNFTIRKTAFIKLGGFHPDNIPDALQIFQGDGETGLTRKGKALHEKALYHPHALLYHQIPSSRLTYEYFDRRAFYQGVFKSYTILRYKESYSKTVNSIYSKFLKKVKRIGRRFTKRSNSNKELTPKDEIMIRFQKKIDEGYLFHQDAFNNNEKVRNWVLKENYFDYQLPSH